MSCFGNEDERLTIGGAGYDPYEEGAGGLFEFRSIRLIKERQNLLWFVRAASLLNVIINGECAQVERDFVKSTLWYFEVICSILESLDISVVSMLSKNNVDDDTNILWWDREK